MILLTQCYHHRGTRLNAMKRFGIICSLKPKCFEIFPPDWGMLTKSIDAFIFFGEFLSFKTLRGSTSDSLGDCSELWGFFVGESSNTRKILTSVVIRGEIITDCCVARGSSGVWHDGELEYRRLTRPWDSVRNIFRRGFTSLVPQQHQL